MELIIEEQQSTTLTNEDNIEPKEETMVVKPSSDSCAELKSINYKIMLLKRSNSTTPRAVQLTDSSENLDKFLEDEKKTNVLDSWSNLDKTLKMKKLVAYAEVYKLDNSLNEEEHDRMLKFLKDSLDHKKLQRVKDIVYDKTTGVIKSIPALAYNKTTSHFTLKNVDKRVSTLKSLPPKKNRGTAKL